MWGAGMVSDCADPEWRVTFLYMSNETLEHASSLLDTMLGYLGFVVRIEEDPNNPGTGLQIHSEEAEILVGKRGQRLEDIQYLVNRIIQIHEPKAPRVRVDIEHYRTMREDVMLEKIRKHAERVRTTGKPLRLDPMNSYQRRIVHNAFKDDPDLTTWSPDDRGRLKRITIVRRKKEGEEKP